MLRQVPVFYLLVGGSHRGCGDNVAEKFWRFGIHSERFSILWTERQEWGSERKIEIGRDGVSDDRRKVKNTEKKRGSQRLRG